MERIEKALAKSRANRKPHRPRAVEVAASEDDFALIDQPDSGEQANSGVEARSKQPSNPPYNGSIVALDYRNSTADLFRILRTQVLKALRKIDGTTLGVCSANAGEGKTFVASNLAASIALSQEQPVLLLDLDLRRPGVHELFKLESTPGVTEFLAGQASLTECVRRTALDKLQIFPAGHPIRNSSEALGSTQLARIFDQLRKAIPGRILVCDMPPLLTSDDTLMFSSKLDATILVVAEGQTRPGEIQRSLELLDAGTVIGTVLNKSKINNAFPYSAYGS